MNDDPPLAWQRSVHAAATAVGHIEVRQSALLSRPVSQSRKSLNIPMSAPAHITLGSKPIHEQLSTVYPIL